MLSYFLQVQKYVGMMFGLMYWQQEDSRYVHEKFPCKKIDIYNSLKIKI